MRSLRYLLTGRRETRTRTVLAAALAAAIVGAAFVPAAAGANTLVVTTTTDQIVMGCPANCSLRDAVSMSNPGDTITIPAGHYVLLFGQIEITFTLTLAGSGARTTVIDGNASSGIFLVQAAAGDEVSIRDVSLVNAAGAGAITANGPSATSFQTLSLLRMTIANNQSTASGGGVVANFTSMAIASCTLRSSLFPGSFYGSSDLVQ